MQIKVYLESLTKNSARCRTQYTIKIRLTLSGWMDVKWITYPHNNIQHRTSMITLMDLRSWQYLTVECILFCLLSLGHTPEWQKVKLGKDRQREREKRKNYKTDTTWVSRFRSSRSNFSFLDSRWSCERCSQPARPNCEKSSRQCWNSDCDGWWGNVVMHPASILERSYVTHVLNMGCHAGGTWYRAHAEEQ